MGTVRFYTDADGNKECLEGHEGYVAHELSTRRVYDPGPGEPMDMGDYDETSKTWWSGTWATGMPELTLRYRPTCECGWAGPIFDAVKSDRWRAEVVDDPQYRGYLPDRCEDELMEAWGDHADALVAQRVTLDPIAAANRDLRRATDALHRAIRDARVVGRSWAEIASQLGVSKQAAWERYRHIDHQLTEGPDNPRS